MHGHPLWQCRASGFGAELLLMDRLMSATTTGAKFKLFGFLKGLFTKTDADNADVEERSVNELPPQPPTPPTPKSSNPARNGNGNRASHASNRDVASVSISLSSILPGLPADLQSKVRQR